MISRSSFRFDAPVAFQKRIGARPRRMIVSMYASQYRFSKNEARSATGCPTALRRLSISAGRFMIGVPVSMYTIGRPSRSMSVSFERTAFFPLM